MNEKLDPSPVVKREISRENRETLDLNIFLAEDDPIVARYVATILGRLGCTVTTVDNGEDLIEKLKEATLGKLDIIISDLEMPRKNGLEVLRFLRNGERFREMPFILYSGLIFEEISDKVDLDKEECVFLQKPFSRDALVQAIKKARSMFEKGL